MTQIDESQILNARQKSFLSSFVKRDLNQVFYLSGGTALAAFYLRHRFSEDLDFFTNEEVDLESVFNFLHSLPGLKEIKFEKKYDRRIFILFNQDGNSLKVEFTRYPFPALEKKTVVSNLQIDSLLDILANKLWSLTDRREAKDYIDVFFIFKSYPALKIKDSVNKAEHKFGVTGLAFSLQSRLLENFKFDTLPLLIPIDRNEVVDFMGRLAGDLIDLE